MKDINTITVSGVVINQPDMKHVGAKNTALLTFRLYSEREYSYQGVTKVDKNYFSIKVWGQHASDTAADLREGNRVTIQGRLTQETWESGGQRKYKVLVVAETVVNNDLVPFDASDRAPAPVATAPPKNVITKPTSKPKPPAFDSSPLDVKHSVLDEESIDDIPF